MSRLTATLQTETAKTAVHLGGLVELAFPSPIGTVRCSTADRDVTYANNTYSANGMVLAEPEVVETTDQNTSGIKFVLSGVDGTLINAAMTTNYQYARAQFYLAVFDENWNLIDVAALGDELIMSSALITLAGPDRIELAVEHWDILGEQDSVVMGTPENQKQRYAGDTFFDNVAAILTQEVEWFPGPNVVISAGGGPVGGPHGEPTRIQQN